MSGDAGEDGRWRDELEELLDDIEDEWIDHYLRPDSAERAKCKRCGGDDFFKSGIEHTPGCLVGRIRAALTPSPCPGDVEDEEQPGDYLRDGLLNIATICEAKALHVEAASLRSTARIVSEQLRKAQQSPEMTRGSVGHVKVLCGLLQEFVEAMERYQMDVDDDAPPRHRDMMERAYAALTPSALSGDIGEAEKVAAWLEQYPTPLNDLDMAMRIRDICAAIRNGEHRK